MLFILLTLLLSAPQGSTAQSSQIAVGQGISFAQVDFLWDEETTLNSTSGQIEVDIATLAKAMGISSGFVNVRTRQGWMVKNLPIPAGFPYPTMSTYFPLPNAVGVNVASLNAFVGISSAPLLTAPAGPSTRFPVGDHGINAEGMGDQASAPPQNPPDPTAVVFSPIGPIVGVVQSRHKTVQAGDEQCAPAAVADSFQWLEDVYKINIPHDNVPGVAVNGKPDNSLVGQLDSVMGRRARDRADGDRTQWDLALFGKLSYLARNGITNLALKHQGLLGGEDVSETRGGKTVTSAHQGETVYFNFLFEQISKGEDVELCYQFALEGLFKRDEGRGHCVVVVGAGWIAGQPFIMYQDDQLQTARNAAGALINDDNKTRTGFAFISDLGGVKLHTADHQYYAKMAWSESVPGDCHQGSDSTGEACPGLLQWAPAGR